MKTSRTRHIPSIAKPAHPEKAAKPIGLNGIPRSIPALAKIKEAIMKAVLPDLSYEITINPCPPPCNALPFLGFSTFSREQATLVILQADPTIIDHLYQKGIKRISLGPNAKPEEITALFKLLETLALDWRRFSQPSIQFNKY